MQKVKPNDPAKVGDVLKLTKRVRGLEALIEELLTAIPCVECIEDIQEDVNLIQEDVDKLMNYNFGK